MKRKGWPFQRCRDLLCPNQGRRSSSRATRIEAEAVSGTFPKQLLNAMGNLVNVVVGAVVDASVYAFAAEDIVVFASLDVILTQIYFT